MTFKGSSFKHLQKDGVRITLGCITPEARDLLDRLCEEYERTRGKSIHDTDGYSALYWAVRWSGLIEPKGGE